MAPRELATGPQASSAGQQLAEVFAAAACRECHSAQGAASDSRLIFLRRGAAAQEIEEAIASFRELVYAPDPTQARLFRKPTKRKQKSKKYKKDLKEDFEESVRASAEGAIQKLLFEPQGATVAGLLSTTTYLNDEAMKALNGEGKDDRIGLMMHPQVLAAHTKEI